MLGSVNLPGKLDTLASTIKRKTLPSLEFARQKYRTALVELQEEVETFSQIYRPHEHIPETELPDAKERYKRIRQREGTMDLAMKEFRPRIENNSRTECNDLDREVMEIESQITAIKLDHADVFSRYTTTIGDAMGHEDGRNELHSQHGGSQRSVRSSRSSVVEKIISK